jgi:hypothetical protein
MAIGGRAWSSSGLKGANAEPVSIVAVVGYRYPDDVANCVRALARSSHTNFLVSVCENGRAEAFQALVEELGRLALPSTDHPRPVDQRIARTWSGRLNPGNQPIQVFEARRTLVLPAGRT